MAVSLTGLVNGIDTAALVETISQSYQRPIELLEVQAASYGVELTAWGNVKSALSSLQGASIDLGLISTANNRSATSSNESAVTASAQKSAPLGAFDVTVNNLAQSESLYTANTYSNADSKAIGTGTLTIQVGTDASVAVEIDGSNNTLNGIAEAINNSGAGVTAGVIYDGSGYRLTVTGDKTGADNSIDIQVSGATGDLADLSYTSGTQNMLQSREAKDASAVVNGIPITSASNTLTQAVPGVSLTLNQAGTSQINVSQSGGAVEDAVQAFVDGYNDAMATLNALTELNEETRERGPLLGNPALNSIRNDLMGLISDTGFGLTVSGKYNALAAVGIELNQDGTLAFDSSKLSSALQEDYDSVAGLFSQLGVSDTNSVLFKSSGSNTVAGSYAVNISQQAEQAVVQASAAIQPTGLAADENLTITFGSTATNVALTAGDDIAAVVDKINDALTSDGVSGVSAFNESGTLVLRSAEYGSDVSFSITSDNSAVDGSQTGLSASASDSGVNVAGTIGGYAAIGEGRTLRGLAGSIDGLELEVSGNATGYLGNVNISEGLFNRLNNIINDALDSKTGAVTAATDGINAQLDSIEKRIDYYEDTAETQTARLQAQFDAMNATLTQLQSTQNFLTEFFGSLESSDS